LLPLLAGNRKRCRRSTIASFVRQDRCFPVGKDLADNRVKVNDAFSQLSKAG
jgi:hypothetical protein